jgi:hypothetical protein
MRSKLTITALVVVMLAVAGVTLASASDGSSGDGARVIELFAVLDQEAFVNVPPDAASPGVGSTTAFSDILYDAPNGERVGVTGGACTITNVRPETAPTEATAQCDATLELSGGQIAVQGLVHFPLAEGEVPPTFDIAITGGTGDFEDADGHLTVEELNATDSNLTVHLSGS